MTKKLLVIDDDISTLEMMRIHFESENFEVFTADNGKSGLALGKKEEFDIILTDLNLPDTDGIDMVNSI